MSETAVDWFTPARRQAIDRMTRETEQLDRELDEAEARRALEAFMRDAAQRYLRKYVPTESSR